MSSIAIATVRKKDEMRVQNVEIAGKRLTQDEFNLYFYPQNLRMNGKEGEKDQGETYQKTKVL